MNNFDMSPDAKMLLTIAALKKYRDCIDEYIYRLEEAMKLKAKALYYEEKIKNDSIKDDDFDEMFHIGEQLQINIDYLRESQNKINKIAKGINNLF